eukprot:TRINITY_DN2664_c0_g1_i3.p1 TRINITY_DN2664_c0_g1~~TRINITY_DN2664_c0_g1_i3.p1  ORF type:complete len:1856 (+),score=717.09 TRINITY_DN2664_c0_g1_i3:584-6151(+)
MKTHENYQRIKNSERKTLQDLPRLEYDLDWINNDDLAGRVKQHLNALAKEKEIGVNRLHWEYLLRYIQESDEENKKLRRQDLIDLFEAWEPGFDRGKGPEFDLCQRSFPPPTFQKKRMQFMITPRSFTVALGEMEPFFFSLYLANVKEKKRLSENFYFHLNSDRVMQLIPQHGTTQLPRGALFNLNAPPKTESLHGDTHSDIVFILRVDKVLQPTTLEESQEPYIKLQMHSNEKERRRVQEAVGPFCKRLGEYRQPFAWAATRVFEGNPPKFRFGDAFSFEQFFRCSAKEIEDSQLWELVRESHESPRNFEKKVKEIPGVLTLDVAHVTSPSQLVKQTLFDPSFDLKPVEDIISELRPERSVKEVQDFPEVEDIFPHDRLINDLFVYPETVNLSRISQGKHIMVKVQLREDDLPASKEGLPVCYTGQFSNKLSQSLSTPIQTYNKQPNFNSEFKLKMPVRLKKGLHLFFQFFHVSIKPKKKSSESDFLEIPLGYSYLEISADEPFPEGSHTLPVYTAESKKLKATLSPNSQNNNFFFNYFSDRKDEKENDTGGSGIGGKPTFRVRLQLKSSIYSANPNLTSFLTSYRGFHDRHRLQTSIVELHEIPAEIAGKFLPIIFTGLLSTMSLYSKDPMALECLRSVMSILGKIYSQTDDLGMGRLGIVESYLQYSFSLTKEKGAGEYVYETITNTYLIYLLEKKNMGALSGGGISVQDVQLCWFFFDVIIKSMTLQVLPEEYNMEPQNRSKWFSASFMLILKKLITFLSGFMVERCQGELAPGELKGIFSCNKHCALFIKDLFHIFDRGNSIEILEAYVSQMTPAYPESSGGTKLLLCKLDFFKIVYDTEHLIPLNFPLIFPPPSEDMMSHYPLTGLLISEIYKMIKHSLHSIRMKAISLVSEILCKFAYDDRYTSNGPAQSRMALIFFGMLTHIVQNWNGELIRGWRSKNDQREMKTMYISILWIAYYIPNSYLMQWLHNQTEIVRNQYLDLLRDIADTFQYGSPLELGKFEKSPERSSFHEMVPAGLSRKQTAMMSVVSPDAEPQQSHSKIHVSRHVTPPIPKNVGNFQEGGLIFQVGLRLLELLENFSDHFLVRQDFCEGHSKMMHLLAGILQNQSYRFLEHACAYLRQQFLKFKRIFFENSSMGAVGDIPLLLLGYTNSFYDPIRESATSILFLFIQNQQYAGNFRKVGIQLTTALAKLVSEKNLLNDSDMLVASLKKLVSLSMFQYSVSHGYLESLQGIHVTPSQRVVFVRQMEDLSEKLMKILRDSVQIKDLIKADEETISDLTYEISLSYQSTPEIQLSWLQALYDRHIKNKCYAEAGMTMVRAATIMTEYLKQFNVIDYGDFSGISPDFHQVIEEEEPGLCTNEDLIVALEKAISNFELAELEEYSVALMKIAMSVWEALGKWKELSEISQRQSALYRRIMEKQSAESASWGQYYRIGFYGREFKELNNCEFVYKEHKGTHLYELSQRLKSFYGDKFECGENNIVVFPDSNPVDVTKLDPTKQYLQITSVEPFFSPQETSTRSTNLQRNTSLYRFIYSTPFTKKGGAHGSVREQYLRKTILTVGNPYCQSFPGIFKRIPVISRKEVIVTPIENAIDSMDKMNLKFQVELRANPLNLKNLQALLQGSILTTVNEGPLEIGKQFLRHAHRFNEDHVTLLKKSLSAFLKLVEEALNVNDIHITSDQVHVQEALMDGFNKLQRRMTRYLTRGDKNDGIQLENHVVPEEHHSDESDGETSAGEDELTPELSTKIPAKTPGNSSFILNMPPLPSTPPPSYSELKDMASDLSSSLQRVDSEETEMLKQKMIQEFGDDEWELLEEEMKRKVEEEELKIQEMEEELRAAEERIAQKMKLAE